MPLFLCFLFLYFGRKLSGLRRFFIYLLLSLFSINFCCLIVSDKFESLALQYFNLIQCPVGATVDGDHPAAILAQP
jgi:hypothetical protein